MSDEYRKNLEEKQREKLNELLETLPDFARKFFRSMIIHHNSTNTILSYAYDIKSFFDYMMEQPGFRKKDRLTLPIQTLEQLNKDDLDEYLIYLAHHKTENGRSLMNSESTMRRKVASLRSFYQ